MDSAEHTASDEASWPRAGRRLWPAIVAALVLLALGWLVSSLRTMPGPNPAALSSADRASRNAQGIIRMTPDSQTAREPGTVNLAGLKLEQSLRTPIRAEPGRGGPAQAQSAE